MDWLNLLTPTLEATAPGRTTLASVIGKVMSQEYSIDLIAGDDGTQTQVVAIQINTIVASFVADGMARVGWDKKHIYNLTRANVGDINPISRP